MTTQLVTVAWLKEHLYDEHLIILDASAIYDATQTIAGARHFDIKNTFSDPENPLPNSFPSATHFEKEVRQLGINGDSHVIVYDSRGIFTGPRVWWMFKAFGHSAVSVLDGGLPSWKASGYALTHSSNDPIELGNFKARLNTASIKSFEDVQANIDTQDYVLVDARSSGRFQGTDPEPRLQLNSGHIENSINLPYTEVLEDGKYKSTTALRAIFSGLQLDKKPIIFSCGSGITACIILLAYDLISDDYTSVYDGSWTEWATRNNLLKQ